MILVEKREKSNFLDLVHPRKLALEIFWLSNESFEVTMNLPVSDAFACVGLMGLPGQEKR
jgi:hypothetical protein